VVDATRQTLAYIYGREKRADADTAHVLTMDEAWRIAANIAKLPELLKRWWLALGRALGCAASPTECLAELKPAFSTVSSNAVLRAGSV
jgi:hypothetical protein